MTHLTNQTTILSRYKNCIVTQLGLNQDTHAMPSCRDTKPVSRYKTPCHVASKLRRVVTCHYASLRARSASSRLLARLSHALPSSVSLLCHDTIYCIVTKTGKWVVTHPAACNPFFFTHFFFPFLFSATVRPQNIYIYIFMSSVEQNKFYIIYLFIFFLFYTL